MPRRTELSDEAKRRLAQIIDKELLGGAEPSISLHDLADDGDLLNSSEFMVPYLNAELQARGSCYIAESVEYYYFDFSPYRGPVLGPICYLALVDPTTQTRRLFTLGSYKPGITWMPEQNSGPTFERDRQFVVDGHRQRELNNRIPAAMLEFLAPTAARVRAYVERVELADETQRDIAAVLKHTSWEQMSLENLVYIALALGTTLNTIMSTDSARPAS